MLNELAPMVTALVAVGALLIIFAEATAFLIDAIATGL